MKINEKLYKNNEIAHLKLNLKFKVYKQFEFKINFYK